MAAAPPVQSAPAAPPPGPPRGRARLWWGVRLLTAAGAGALLYASFPPRTLWWLAPLAFALLGALLRGRRARTGFGLGFAFGLGFLAPLLIWTGSYVGPLPWLVLAAFEALFIGAAGAGMALVSRLPGAPGWAAAVWIAGEAARGRVPFGGLPWGRIGFGQPDGPLLPIAAVGGVPLLSFVTVLAGLALAEAGRRLVRTGTRPRAALPALLVVAALVAGPAAALVPVTRTGPDTTVTIAAVQGNVPRLGLDFNAQRRAVLDNHVRVTEQLAADVAAGREPQPDLVIWPENSSDIDPLRNPDAAAQIDRAARASGVPILVGAVLRNPGGETTSNSSLVWQPGVGPVERNDKRRVQPFGEYIPWRSFFRLFSSYVDRAGNFVPGPGPGVVSMAGVPVGVAICWEVAFDDLVTESVTAGAGVLAVPSNNATFGLSEMTYQQLAMSRVRAVEHDRSVIVATTSGVSATIAPDGTVTASSPQFAPATLVDQTVVRGTTTLATRLRSVPEWVLTALGVVAVGVAVVATRRSRASSGAAPAGTQAGEDDDG
ncbi:apolipoprotein N-acyltransferase [Pseudonocardia asaccharolytica]|uniref:Apolipoprotein N-acyltransferase n=1 Tax=Pseudonocardia asaccharolytica DSM 44247 = NBRC 16224 TaxID=1123024 RepID=A0A511D9U8_9PSEU|nr:apolipoprotein N-acyltransferase [Pseudonocardia asaccharolytica]GEL20414.1 apolipoprotein N-acyltransferase [Pseudonocardia asaccharolytica DSM 44247 = NBRC 16224]